MIVTGAIINAGSVTVSHDQSMSYTFLDEILLAMNHIVMLDQYIYIMVLSVAALLKYISSSNYAINK